MGAEAGAEAGAAGAAAAAAEALARPSRTRLWKHYIDMLHAEADGNKTECAAQIHIL
jgi:hypothetical protein